MLAHQRHESLVVILLFVRLACHEQRQPGARGDLDGEMRSLLTRVPAQVQQVSLVRQEGESLRRETVVDDCRHGRGFPLRLAVTDRDQLHMRVRGVHARQLAVAVVMDGRDERVRTETRQLDRPATVEMHDVEAARIARDVAQRPRGVRRVHVRVRRPLRAIEVRPHLDAAIDARIARRVHDDLVPSLPQRRRQFTDDELRPAVARRGHGHERCRDERDAHGDALLKPRESVHCATVRTSPRPPGDQACGR